MALLICTEKINPRISYVFQHIFGNILGVDFSFCHDLNYFKSYNGPKIIYSKRLITGCLNFKKNSFTDETAITEQNLAFADYNGLKIPFAVNNSAFGFDVFAATFFLLSRYEEYTFLEKDEHQRFEGKASVAYKNGFLKRPLIDEWAYEIANIITKAFPKFEVKKREFKYIPTLDIDRPFYFKNDGFVKRLAKFTLGRFKKDPFDVYQQVANWDKRFNLNTIYFFLVGTKHANDGSPGSANKLYQSVIQQAVKTHQIGIHPSYFAALNPDEVKEEKRQLEKASDSEITISRQHYLMLRFPETYRALVDAGIKADYTLAFADVAGFRASTCTPFFWYDLKAEQCTTLTLYPTAVMDQTLRRYMNLTPDDALAFITELVRNVKTVNGTFISLWHNESVNDFGVWKGWKTVYEQMLALSRER
ncbi:polysaccharide deacetylase family protein [Pedobacter arcticus]|uniref:polysaccharide deacetylase family protein n=1 Tax=Pedobacter arcticus TaxID=752140 RepID=UPI0002FBDD4D|nr:polysaccharide deacetylase family protein [Pedobacter arcticus]